MIAALDISTEDAADLLADLHHHLTRAMRIVRRLRREHGPGCSCPFCSGVRPIDVAGLHADLPGIAWTLAQLRSTVLSVTPSVSLVAVRS